MNQISCYWCGKQTTNSRFCSKRCEDETVCSDCHHDKYGNWEQCPTCAKFILQDNLETIERLKKQNQYIRMLLEHQQKKKSDK